MKKSHLIVTSIVAWGNFFKRLTFVAFGITPSSHFRTLAFALLLLAASTGMVQAQNLIANGDFASGTTGWTGNNFSVVSGEAFISSTNSAGNLWDTQLTQGGITFTTGNSYTFTFQARAAANRNMTVAIQNSANGWTDQFRKTYALTTSMQTFTETINCTFTATGSVQLGFLMAGLSSTAAIYYDNVSITIANPPTLATTTAATSITTTSAVSGGNVTSQGGGSVTARGVVWSTSTSPTVALSTKTTDGSGTGSFTSNITGLSSGVKYYVRSYATNSSGTGYGAEINFTTTDTEAPTSFTATKGAVTFNSVQLLLNATDNSTGTITYTISYGSTNLTTTGTSGTQTLYLVTGLTASTDYTFSVSAKDASNNAAANNPIIVTATTTENTNTECSGFSTEKLQDANFLTGYNYTFSTTGSGTTASVKVDFELLDDRSGVVTYAWTYNPNFAETGMTLVSGKKYTQTFTNQTIGATFTVACKFAFAGGQSVTKKFLYTVGNSCLTVPGKPTIGTATAGNTQASVAFTAPASNGGSAITGYTVTSSPGGLTATGTASPIVITGLTNGTAYTFTVKATNGIGTGSDSNASSQVTPHATNNIIVVSTNSTISGLTLTGVSDLKVTNGVTLTGNVSKTVNSITVESGGKLNLTSGNPLVVGTLTFKAVKDESSFSSKLDAGIMATNVRLFKTIDDTKWYFMAFPCDVNVAGITKSNGGSLGVLGTDWFIKYYDGDKRSKVGVSGGSNWISVTEGTLTAKKGYIFGLKTGTPETEILFPLNPSILAAEGASTVPVLSYSSGLAGSSHLGWNLVGQPYLSIYNAQLNSSAPNYMIMPDANGKTYTIKAKGTSSLPTAVNPFAAYFVQAASDGTISFELSGRQGAPSVANSLSENVQVNVTTTTGYDDTYLIMDNDQTTDYQIGEDMEKWIGTGTDKPQIYTLLNGINYAFNALPMSTVVNLPIGFYTKTAGLTTINVNALQAPSLSKLLLTDNSTSPAIVTDLLTSDYTFNTAAGTDNSRFVITARRVSTDNNLVESGADEPTLMISNSKLIINNVSAKTKVRIFDVIGRLVITKTGTKSSFEIPLTVAGLYMVQIGTETKNWTKKIINKK